MEYTVVKAAVRKALGEVAEEVLATLFWRAEELTLRAGEEIYREGDEPDDTVAILVGGELSFFQGTELISQVSEPVCFGEVGFFGAQKKRTATVRVSSEQATILRFEIDPEEMKSGTLSDLGKVLKARAWVTVVQDSKRKF